jgi:serine/threonine-protein kinase
MRRPAAGIVLWELAAGRRMYKAGDGRESLLEQARKAEIPELPRQGLPAEDQLRAVVSKALSRDRDARYPSAAAMQRELDAYAASARLMTSPLALGEWLKKTFGEDILDKRRARERASEALEKGVPVVLQRLEPVGTSPSPVVPPPSVRSLPPAATGPHDLEPHAARPKGRTLAIALAVSVLLAVAASIAAFALRG